MAILASTPALEKTWEFDLNHRLTYPGGTAELINLMLYTWKETWKGWSVGGATVAGSSDASSNWGWGSDYWTSGTFPSNNNPWIVLNLTGGGQFLLYRTSTAYTSHGHYSPGGLYTGGGLNTVPTATDEFQVWTNYLWGTLPTTDVLLNFWHSTDGKYEIILPFTNNLLMGYFVMLGLEDPVANWNSRILDLDDTNNNYIFTRLSTNSNLNFAFGGTWYTGSFTSPGKQEFGISEVSELQVNQLTGRHPMARISFGCRYAGARGWHGRIPDMYWGNAVNATGTFFEDDLGSPTFEWVQIGDIVMPWDGVETSVVQA